MNRPSDLAVAIAALIAGIVFTAALVADPPSAPPPPTDPGTPVERGR